jgi:hypothetical protein
MILNKYPLELALQNLSLLVQVLLQMKELFHLDGLYLMNGILLISSKTLFRN